MIICEIFIQFFPCNPIRNSKLIDFFDKLGLRYVDLLSAFERNIEVQPIKTLFAEGGHYSPQSNEIVADALHDYLNEHEMLHAESLGSLISGEQQKFGESLQLN